MDQPASTRAPMQDPPSSDRPAPNFRTISPTPSRIPVPVSPAVAAHRRRESENSIGEKTGMRFGPAPLPKLVNGHGRSASADSTDNSRIPLRYTRRDASVLDASALAALQALSLQNSSVSNALPNGSATASLSSFKTNGFGPVSSTFAPSSGTITNGHASRRSLSGLSSAHSSTYGSPYTVYQPRVTLRRSVGGSPTQSPTHERRSSAPGTGSRTTGQWKKSSNENMRQTVSKRPSFGNLDGSEAGDEMDDEVTLREVNEESPHLKNKGLGDIHSPMRSNDDFDPNNLLNPSSPLLSDGSTPPALPPRSPLRPRMSGQSDGTPSRANSYDGIWSEGDPASAGLPGGDHAVGQVTGLGVSAVPRMSIADGSRRQKSRNTLEDREFVKTPGAELWLNDDTEPEGDLAIPRVVRSSSKSDEVTPMNIDDAVVEGERAPTPRLAKDGSRMSSRAKRMRREARVTSRYLGDYSGSGDSDSSVGSGGSSAFGSKSSARGRGRISPHSPRHSPLLGASTEFLGSKSPSCPTFNNLSSEPSSPIATPLLAPLAGVGSTSVGALTLSDSRLPDQSTLAHRPASQPAPLPRTPATTRRGHLLHEIHSTERSYSDDLQLIRNAYPLPFTRPASASAESFRPQSVASESTSTFSNRNSTASTSHTSTTSMTTATTTATSAKPPPFGSSKSTSSATSPAIPGILTSAETRAIFLNLEAVASLAQQFAGILEIVSDDNGGNGDRVGEAFVSMMPQIQAVYTSYCSRQSGANSYLARLMLTPKYTTYFTECWSTVQPHTKAWDLPSILIKPVQRILKYPLLLSDLLELTPPSHPDYPNLKTAATTIRAVADEINEVKRRKETVERVIGGRSNRDVSGASSTMSRTSTASTKDSKSKKGKLVFGGRKNTPSAPAPAPIASSFNASTLAEVRKSESLYASLVERLTLAESTSKKMGKNIVNTEKRTRETWEAQINMIENWRKMINLSGLEPVEDVRIEAFREVLFDIVSGPCQEFEEELRNSILPTFNKLFMLCQGPRAVILKRNSKLEDFSRVTKAGPRSALPTDNTILEGAEIFYALHQQLVAELPLLLDGYRQIMDMVLRALATCHAKYQGAVHAKLVQFWTEFPPVTGDVTSDELAAAMSGEQIIQTWKEAFDPTIEVIDQLAITQKTSARLVDQVVHTASGNSSSPMFSDQPGARSSIMSPTSSNPRTPVEGAIPRTSTTSSGSGERPMSSYFVDDHPKTRSRSSSLLNTISSPVTPPASPGIRPHGQSGTSTSGGGIFGFRKSEKKRSNDTDNSSRNPALAPPKPEIIGFSGPMIPSLSFDKNGREEHFAESVIRRLSDAKETFSSENSIVDDDAFDAPPMVMRRRQAAGDVYNAVIPVRSSTVDNHQKRISHHSRTSSIQQDYHKRHSRNPSEPIRISSIPTTTEIAQTPVSSQKRVSDASKVGISPGPSYSDTLPLYPDQQKEFEGFPSAYDPTLYKCECVADFDLGGLELTYMGHEFLKINRGEHVDILYEVGRVDELEDFPLDVGLEDDGLLIGRTKSGLTGFLLCSFLHPLFEGA